MWASSPMGRSWWSGAFRPSGERGQDAGGLSGEGAAPAPRRSGDPPCIPGGAHPHAYHTGNATDITNRLAVYAPILMDALPLTLEEIFIYELGGEDYEVRDIVL